MFDWLKKKKPPAPPLADPPAAPAPVAPPAQHFGVLLGRWVRMELPLLRLHEPFLGFVYFDAQAGLSMKGGAESDPELIERPGITVRLPMPGLAQPLTADEVKARALPARPSWLAVYGPQPDGAAPWRTDVDLVGRFHLSFPDDLQVVVHDGEPRRTGVRPELCWARVVAAEPAPPRRFILGAAATESRAASSSVYVATLLSAPHHLKTIRQGAPLRFLAGAKLKHPLLVTPEYLVQRAHWWIQPCDGCGLGECYDPPNVMIGTRFPQLPPGESMEAFTAFCAECPGRQLLSRKADLDPRWANGSPQ